MQKLFLHIISLLFSAFLAYSAAPLFAHEFHEDQKNNQLTQETQAQITSLSTGQYIQYLGNEGLFIQAEHAKVLFDPFFHHNLGIYQLVPDDLKQRILSGIPPYNNINAVFISHAHRDHFAVDDMVTYLTHFPQTKLVASEQAINQVKAYAKDNKITLDSSKLVSVSLNFGDSPFEIDVEHLNIDAVRIPHAGWPSRAEVENLVFRVTLDDEMTIMHMGDADVDIEHYLPHQSFWRKKTTHANFPPYWFLYSAEGRDILFEIINAEETIGIHVPMKVPMQLKSLQYRYFSKPEERFVLP